MTRLRLPPLMRYARDQRRDLGASFLLLRHWRQHWRRRARATAWAEIAA